MIKKADNSESHEKAETDLLENGRDDIDGITFILAHFTEGIHHGNRWGGDTLTGTDEKDYIYGTGATTTLKVVMERYP